MRRYTGVRILTQCLLGSDIGIFVGRDICKEAQPYIGENENLFFEEEDYLISFALGIAMATDKRVFIFCEDQYFIRNMSELMHSGVSKCRNFYAVLFVNGYYTVFDNAPNIFDSVNSQHGILYNMGFLVHDYTKHFKNSRNPIKDIREIWDRARGPLAILLKTSKGVKQLPEAEMSEQEDLYRAREFIMNKDIEAHSFVPPFSLEDLGLEE